jgi:hypothetical protein
MASPARVAGVVALAATTAYYFLWPKQETNQFYNELRRTPKAGCEQRRRVHEHQELLKRQSGDQKVEQIDSAEPTNSESKRGLLEQNCRDTIIQP